MTLGYYGAWSLQDIVFDVEYILCCMHNVVYFSILFVFSFPMLAGGMMSVFLMGLYDKSRDKFCTVAKCGNGHDDSTIARLQKELDMVKISKVGGGACCVLNVQVAS